MIEREVVIVSLFTNVSDYSNKTCIFCKIQAHHIIPVYTSLVGVVTCIGEERYDYHLSLNHCNTFLPPKMAATIRKYTNVPSQSRSIGVLILLHNPSKDYNPP